MTEDPGTVEPVPRVPPSGFADGYRAAAASRFLAPGRSLLVRLFDQRGKANQRLTLGLALVVGFACIIGLPELIRVFQASVDLETDLRAASHWASGAPVYPPSAMLVASGPDQPYLYPPFLLPLLAPIAALPRALVADLWLALGLVCAAWTCRRLAIPWLAIPFVLAWPPFAEGLIAGNVQIFSFAAFVALLYEPVDGAPIQRTFIRAQDALNGVLAVFVGVFKATQTLPVLYLARRRFRAAVIGVAAIGAMALVLLPLTGFAIYWDWLAQLQRAADPSWTFGGVALGRLLRIPDIVVAIIGIALALSVRGRNSAAWLGIALIVATPSAHGYTFLFLIPALLTVRRDISLLIATLFLGVYHGYAWWLAFVFVAYFLVAGTRWPSLHAIHRSRPSEPRPKSGSGTASAPTISDTP
jgi:hypothetical protein